MTPDGWITILTVLAVFGALAFTRISADLVLIAGVAFLMTVGVLTPSEAFAGFSNPAVVTVGVLFVVAAGIRETGAINYLIDTLLRRPRSLQTAQFRMMLPVALLSGFVNNTPLVAMMVPAVMDWSRKLQFPVSKLLMPLSYAAIVGGMCTLIGTSTNLLIDGLVRESAIPGYESIGFFEITPIGIPCALVTIGYIMLASRWMIPDRSPAVGIESENSKEYALEMIVEESSPLEGKTIEQAGLRHLPGLYLMEIDRDGEVLAAVGSGQKLKGKDRLVFVGILDSVVDLQKIRGLKPATNQVFKLEAPNTERTLIEAVVSNTSPMLGKSIREGRFRSHYNAAVIAVARNGERINKKIGDIMLQPGDTLLLESHPDFLIRHRNSRDFYLVSGIDGYTPPRHDRAWISIGIMAAMVLLATAAGLPILVAAFLAAGAMIASRCVSSPAAHRSIDWRVLLAIGAALGLGQALTVSGAAHVIASNFVQLAGGNPWVALLLVYAMTSFFTEIVTNNASAALIFPVALAASQSLGVNFQPYVIAIMIASSASFATPIGYQTNLMIYGPGGYRFSDFLRAGIPLNILLMITATLLIPLIYPL